MRERRCIDRIRRRRPSAASRRAQRVLPATEPKRSCAGVPLPPGNGLASSRFTPCPVCGLKVNAQKLDRHKERNHPREATPEERAARKARDEAAAKRREEERRAERERREAERRRWEPDIAEVPPDLLLTPYEDPRTGQVRPLIYMDSGGRPVDGSDWGGEGEEEPDDPSEAGWKFDGAQLASLLPPSAWEGVPALQRAYQPWAVDADHRRRLDTYVANLRGAAESAHEAGSSAEATYERLARCAEAARRSPGRALWEAPSVEGRREAALVECFMTIAGIQADPMWDPAAPYEKSVQERTVENLQIFARDAGLALTDDDAPEGPAHGALELLRDVLLRAAEVARDLDFAGLLERAEALAFGEAPPAREEGLRHILAHSPGDAAAACALGRLLASQGRIQETADDLRLYATMSLAPHEVTLQAVLLLADAGQEAEARKLAKEVLALLDSGQVPSATELACRLNVRLVLALLEEAAGLKPHVPPAGAAAALELTAAEDNRRFEGSGKRDNLDERREALRAPWDVLARDPADVVLALCDLVRLVDSWSGGLAIPLLGVARDPSAAEALACASRGHSMNNEAAYQALLQLGPGAMPGILEVLHAVEDEEGIGSHEFHLLPALAAVGTREAVDEVVGILQRGEEAGAEEQAQVAAFALTGVPDEGLVPHLRRQVRPGRDPMDLREAVSRLRRHRPKWPVDGATCDSCGSAWSVAVLDRGKGRAVCLKCWGEGEPR